MVKMARNLLAFFLALSLALVPCAPAHALRPERAGAEQIAAELQRAGAEADPAPISAWDAMPESAIIPLKNEKVKPAVEQYLHNVDLANKIAAQLETLVDQGVFKKREDIEAFVKRSILMADQSDPDKNRLGEAVVYFEALQVVSPAVLKDTRSRAREIYQFIYLLSPGAPLYIEKPVSPAQLDAAPEAEADVGMRWADRFEKAAQFYTGMRTRKWIVKSLKEGRDWDPLKDLGNGVSIFDSFFRPPQAAVSAAAPVPAAREMPAVAPARRSWVYKGAAALAATVLIGATTAFFLMGGRGPAGPETLLPLPPQPQQQQVVQLNPQAPEKPAPAPKIEVARPAPAPKAQGPQAAAKPVSGQAVWDGVASKPGEVAQQPAPTVEAKPGATNGAGPSARAKPGVRAPVAAPITLPAVPEGYDRSPADVLNKHFTGEIARNHLPRGASAPILRASGPVDWKGESNGDPVSSASMVLVPRGAGMLLKLGEETYWVQKDSEVRVNWSAGGGGTVTEGSGVQLLEGRVQGPRGLEQYLQDVSLPQRSIPGMARFGGIARNIAVTEVGRTENKGRADTVRMRIVPLDGTLEMQSQEQKLTMQAGHAFEVVINPGGQQLGFNIPDGQDWDSVEQVTGSDKGFGFGPVPPAQALGVGGAPPPPPVVIAGQAKPGDPRQGEVKAGGGVVSPAARGVPDLTPSRTPVQPLTVSQGERLFENLQDFNDYIRANKDGLPATAHLPTFFGNSRIKVVVAPLAPGVIRSGPGYIVVATERDVLFEMGGKFYAVRGGTQFTLYWDNDVYRRGAVLRPAAPGQPNLVDGNEAPSSEIRHLWNNFRDEWELEQYLQRLLGRSEQFSGIDLRGKGLFAAGGLDRGKEGIFVQIASDSPAVLTSGGRQRTLEAGRVYTVILNSDGVQGRFEIPENQPWGFVQPVAGNFKLGTVGALDAGVARGIAPAGGKGVGGAPPPPPDGWLKGTMDLLKNGKFSMDQALELAAQSSEAPPWLRWNRPFAPIAEEGVWEAIQRFEPGTLPAAREALRRVNREILKLQQEMEASGPNPYRQTNLNDLRGYARSLNWYINGMEALVRAEGVWPTYLLPTRDGDIEIIQETRRDFDRVLRLGMEVDRINQRLRGLGDSHPDRPRWIEERTQLMDHYNSLYDDIARRLNSVLDRRYPGQPEFTQEQLEAIQMFLAARLFRAQVVPLWHVFDEVERRRKAASSPAQKSSALLLEGVLPAIILEKAGLGDRLFPYDFSTSVLWEMTLEQRQVSGIERLDGEMARNGYSRLLLARKDRNSLDAFQQAILLQPGNETFFVQDSLIGSKEAQRLFLTEFQQAVEAAGLEGRVQLRVIGDIPQEVENAFQEAERIVASGRLASLVVASSYEEWMRANMLRIEEEARRPRVAVVDASGIRIWDVLEALMSGLRGPLVTFESVSAGLEQGVTVMAVGESA